MCVRAVKVLEILRLSKFNKDQKSHELAHFIFTKQRNHFCMKSSGHSLISDQNKLLWLMAFNGNLLKASESVSAVNRTCVGSLIKYALAGTMLG